MRILHTGDIHLGDLAGPTKDGENLRRLDTIGCMKAIVEDAQNIKPEVSIIAGDLFNRSRVWADTALDDVNDALEKFVIPLCGCSDEVVLLFGTMNHDNPRAFELIKKATENLSNLHIYTTPAVEKLDTKEGPVQIMAVPGFDKARLRLFYPGMDKEQENRNATALINDTILGLATQLDHSIPAVMTAHYTVSGSEADNGSTFLAGQDVVILPSTIDAAGVDLACFGHIHKPQRLASETPAYYCGSVNQLNFNDEGTEHGFWLHTLQPMMGGNAVASGFIGLPEREHLTLRLSPDTVAQFIADPQSVSFGELVRDKIIRVRYSCTAEQEKALNRADIQKALTADGAFYVAEIVPEDVEELDSKDQLTEHDGPFEALGRWLEHNDITGDKADRLKALAEPIIKKADDGRDDGKHTGAFIPHKIEVKNYRSYTEAEFDFSPVRMAMVNGQNGVGKSSLFMDAIADCLYEHTRKEDIGGWVRDGTKSGAITFTFGMGGQEYRVIRTRTKSGRGTLALQRFDQETGSWADESDTTMKLTQAKIERLLGMDCDTFCSIALIRQDAYGLFLDADSDRRMEVLSSLLGLGIYSRMEEIAKDAAKEQRRKIAATKDRIDILTEQVDKREELMIEDAAKVEKIEEAKRTIAEAEQEQKALEQAEALAAEIKKQADEKASQAKECTRKRNQKADEGVRLQSEYDAAAADGACLDMARTAAQLVKAARSELQELTPKMNELTAILHDMKTAQSDAQAAHDTIGELTAYRCEYEGTVKRKAEIETAQASLESLASRRKEVQTRVLEQKKTAQATHDAKAAVDAHLAESRVAIRGMESNLEALRKEAARLEGSGCPNPDTATCKFLISATNAKRSIPALEQELAQTKADRKAQYEKLLKAYNDAKTADEALGDPATELLHLAAEEETLRLLADLAPRLAAAEASLQKVEEDIKAATEREAAALQKVAELNGQIRSMQVVVERYNAVQKQIEDNERMADRLAACEAAAAKMEALKPQIDRLDREIEELNSQGAAARLEAHSIRERIKPVPYGAWQSIQRRLAPANDIVSCCILRRGEIKAKLQMIDEATEQIEQLRSELTEIAEKLNDYTTLVQAFGIDGIQYMVIRGVVPEIMRQSNDILASMTGGRMAVDFRTEREQKSTKQIVNSLEVWINTISGGTRPYQSHSGGEKVKIALAVTLGLADVKARRAGVQLGMLFIDEPPFLDADGTDAYADALSNMAARNPGMRILAISHDPTMKARFSQNIIVTGGENGSTVTME